MRMFAVGGIGYGVAYAGCGDAVEAFDPHTGAEITKVPNVAGWETVMRAALLAHQANQRRALERRAA
jgi:hypothetical protein